MIDLQTRGMAPTASVPSMRRWRLRIFAVTWIAYAGYYFTRQTFSVAKVGILDDPTVSAAFTQQMLGILDAVYLIAYAVGQFVWGSLADRFGPRVIVLGGLAMSAVAAVFMGLTTAIVLFVPLMIVQGLCQSTGWSSLCKNMSCFFSIKERGTPDGHGQATAGARLRVVHGPHRSVVAAGPCPGRRDRGGARHGGAGAPARRTHLLASRRRDDRDLGTGAGLGAVAPAGPGLASSRGLIMLGGLVIVNQSTNGGEEQVPVEPAPGQTSNPG